MRWYKRSGIRVSKQKVRKAREACANSKRTGELGGFLKVAINPALADRIDEMSLIEFANWSGAFTYKK